MSDLVKEYRPSMDKDVLHSWAQDAVKLIEQQQARIAELEDSVVISKRTAEALVEYRDKLKQERDQLAATVERLRNPWISVEDGLPKQLKPTDLSDFVSVYSELDKKQCTAVYDYSSKVWCCANSFKDLQFKISHWMPQLQPPKESNYE